MKLLSAKEHPYGNPYHRSFTTVYKQKQQEFAHFRTNSCYFISNLAAPPILCFSHPLHIFPICAVCAGDGIRPTKKERRDLDEFLGDDNFGAALFFFDDEDDEY